MDYNVGDTILLELVDNTSFTGVVLPGKQLCIKLQDGYNVSFSSEQIRSITVKQTSPEKKPVYQEVYNNASLPKVHILHTGGTIASKVDYATGGVSNHIESEELLRLYPELQDIAHVEATFIANMSSDDMRFGHYNLLISHIASLISKNPSGIIITHGTDTLHYTAAALHYALRNLPFPVILVGSQRSSDRGSSDAATNLRAAVRFCVSPQKSSGVFICMHNTSDDTTIGVFSGVHVRKMHTSCRDAFMSVNAPVHAVISGDQLTYLTEPKKAADKFAHFLYNEQIRIGMVYAHPHMSADEFRVYENFDGLIILGTGLGHIPISSFDSYTQEHEDIFSVVSLLAQKIPVVMSSQCIFGRLHLQVYSAGRRLQEIGVRGHGMSLSPEALFCKLAFVISNPQFSLDDDLGDVLSRLERGATHD